MLNCGSEAECMKKIAEMNEEDRIRWLQPEASIVNGCEVSTNEAQFYARLLLCDTAEGSGCSICGGSWGSGNRILTAAHCVYNKASIRVFANDNNNAFHENFWFEDHIATNYAIHADYIDGDIGNGYDIAMVKLDAGADHWPHYIEMATMTDFNARQSNDPMIAYGTGTTATGEGVSHTLLEAYPLGFIVELQTGVYKSGVPN